MTTIDESDSDETEDAFVEQAEYIAPEDFLAWSAEHPQEEIIVRRLCAVGAKLLIGPRGCGKTTLLLKAYHQMLSGGRSSAFPVYVNFKLSLRLEPLYVNTPNATFWFRRWLVAKIYEAIHNASQDMSITLSHSIPNRIILKNYINDLELGRTDGQEEDLFSTQRLTDVIAGTLVEVCRPRCVLLLDDAAHAFSPKQQEDFFDFFRQVKSKEISPKAAIYPGITTTSANFHVGHDAEQIDAWIRPDTSEYLTFMRSLALKRFPNRFSAKISTSTDWIDFLAYAAFGIPRSFLNMIHLLRLETRERDVPVERKKLLDAAKISREAAHNVYDSLITKLPAYKNFIENGEGIYSKLLTAIKDYNRPREFTDQAIEVGIKRPISAEITKVFCFFQYAGLLMPAGENSRGNKGVFEIYMVHFGDLITENAVIGRRTKSVSAFVKAFKSQTHQAWPRIASEKLVGSDVGNVQFSLSLPVCQTCGTARVNENAKFCHYCGSPLKTKSVYQELINQDISVLPITKDRVKRIKAYSRIKSVKDILIDNNRQELRSVPYVGPIWAEKIVRYAEEHVA